MKTKHAPRNTSSLPAKLRAWRKRRGMESASAASDALGVNLRTYENWEQGRATPRGFALSTLLERIKQ